VSRAEDWVEIDDVACKIETEKAILVVVSGEEHWLPKMALSDESEVQGRGDKGILIIKEWLALERGIE